MGKSLVNKHKLKRKWSRRMKKTSKLYNTVVSGGAACGSRRDFASTGRKLNPYVKREEGLGWWFYSKVGVLAVCVLGISGLGLYHPFFHVKDLNIIGLQRIDRMEMEDTLRCIFNHRKFHVWPQGSYFIANVDEVRDILLIKYPIKSIVVEKVFPNKINIILEEKISTIIYDNGTYYSYLDLDGKLVELAQKVADYEWLEIKETTTSTDEFGEEISNEVVKERVHKPDIGSVVQNVGYYPIVYDRSEKQVEINERALTPEIVMGVVSWFDHLNRKTDIPLKYFILENSLGDVIIKTDEGWHIKARLKDDLEVQFNELDLILREKVTRPNLSYIDLRYPGRVYWK